MKPEFKNGPESIHRAECLFRHAEEGIPLILTEISAGLTHLHTSRCTHAVIYSFFPKLKRL